MQEIWKLLLYGISSFVFLFVIAKFLGKKQIAELNFIDYAVGISLGSIASNWATDLDTPWWYYVVAMSIFFLFDIAVTLLSRTLPCLKKTLQGKPIVVISNSKLDYQNIKKAKLSTNDVLSMARTRGYFGIKDIAYAIFEPNGELSILPTASQTPLVKEDISTPLSPSTLPMELVIDGRIVDHNLQLLGKDKSWLYQKTHLDDNSLANVLLVTYYKSDDSIDIHVKNNSPYTTNFK